MKSINFSWFDSITLVVSVIICAAATVSAGNYIVYDGAARAEIVTSENPPPSVRLAAAELQSYIKKISGAELPLRTVAEPSVLPVRIFLGRSADAGKLGASADGLAWGAYRMKTGEDWLALIGDDTLFEPRGIYAVNRNDWTNNKKQLWEEAVGIDWGNPVGSKLWDKYNQNLDMWRYDEKGTLNAVYGFLRELGVRWYLPGEIGEIVPEMRTIELPVTDREVRPDYKIRMVAYARYGASASQDEVLWSLRHGMNEPFGYFSHHGIANVSRSEVIRKQHPEYMALYNGERQVLGRTANSCLSSEGLFQENLRFVRAMFDMYDVPVVSVWPDDGFTSICQCDLCLGKDNPDIPRGSLSDYVWDYINRMAIEIGKSHPGKLICGGAYSTYWMPPSNIDRLNSNVVVSIVNGRRRYDMSDEELQTLRNGVRRWSEMSDGKVIIFMNHGGGANTPRLFADDLKFNKGLAMGEDIWPPFSRGGIANPGFNHLNYYITARFQWDADQDIDQVLEEYYRLYYGPAAGAMRDFIDFYEIHQQQLGPAETVDQLRQALALYDRAVAAVEPDSIYGRRVALFGEGRLERLRERYAQIGKGRMNIPSTRITSQELLMKELVVDGRMDEKFWSGLQGYLRDNQTGDKVYYQTRFRVGYYRNHIYIGIRCQDEPDEPLNITTAENEDTAIWDGDYLDILIETSMHSYYQISVNPAGALLDFDRSAEGAGLGWSSLAEVAVNVDKDGGVWTVELKIPYTRSDQDPMHEVIGAVPNRNLPWFINVSRQRKRNDYTERSSFSPTGVETFLHPIKFGRLTAR
ncbi:MAG: DUF4838 domain-containing protein [Kiritimatiellia bacterium]